jgi:hypothetical protein
MNGPRWLKQWIGELAVLNEQFRDENGSVNFDALGREEYAFRVALITGLTKKSERAKLALELAEKAYKASAENGKKGGRPPVKTPLPKNKQEVIEFAIDHNLDPDDASTWAEQNLKERKGKDKFGNRIENWKGALINYCKSETAKRSA